MRHSFLLRHVRGFTFLMEELSSRCKTIVCRHFNALQLIKHSKGQVLLTQSHES